MRRRLTLVVAAAFLSLPIIASAASAQAHVRIGGFIGREFDFEDDFLIFGAEARLRGARMQYDIQPRFQYQSFDGGSSLQLDGNLLFNLTSLVSQIQPYMGLGVALNRFSLDIPDIPGEPSIDSDDTNFGLNIISGLIVGTNPKWRPYVNFQYTSLMDFGNGANLSIGILFQISGNFR
jgi:opacity protein-like surface antigen